MEAASTTTVVRAGLERACVQFSAGISEHRFARTKKMFWTRVNQHTIDFVHFHRSGSSYGAPSSASVAIRVHFGIRVLNDTFPAQALNGPCSDSPTTSAGRYHLRFNASTGSTSERCIEDLHRLFMEIGLPWFERFSDPTALLELADSPLQPYAKKLLQDAVRENPVAEHVAASLKLFGVKTHAAHRADA
ncbi:hypothetical protein [Methyloversatilis sp. XJ19-49]|uniref:hypothetical protein n=1 Tax=Methyloversatilis sp. XJ19-49 TaxID=2963429 RepID=UPI00211BC295|nr:hypothetical protein [Methyloversatilis sp. XJ19-49]MCQ9377670.1 hypothetical protein [Methyloversatilis sp. XJ19-49]